MALSIQKPSHAGPRIHGDAVDFDKGSGAVGISIPTPAGEAVIIEKRAAFRRRAMLFCGYSNLFFQLHVHSTAGDCHVDATSRGSNDDIDAVLIGHGSGGRAPGNG